MSVAIALEGCAKTFADGTRALEPLDLEVRPGETLVLLGPSGCGKTTALRIIAGLEAPDAGGRVRFDGRDVTALPIERRNIGMVFQSYALFPNMTVAENVGYGLKVRRLPPGERRRRVGEMLAMMRIGELAARRVDQLSGGQRQRVALARALAVRPQALLLDEPLTALDAKLREQLRGEIDALLRQLSITALYVTHDQAEAMALADRIVVMSRGRVEQVGTPREIYFSPASDHVAQFIGVQNRIEAAGAEGLLLLGDTRLPWPGLPDGPLVLTCRPEDILLGEGGAAGLPATVASALFEGDRLRLVLSLSDGQRVTALADGRLTLAPGERVTLGLDPARSSWRPRRC